MPQPYPEYVLAKPRTSLAAEREVTAHRPDLLLGRDLVVYVELERTVELAVLTGVFLAELDSEDVLAGVGVG
jgi:hypothetical protein